MSPATDAGTSPWTMLLVALVGGLVVAMPSIFAAIKAWATRRQRAEELAAREAELRLAELNRKEAERQAAEERARLHAAVTDLTSQIKAVTVGQEAAMKVRTDNQASTDAQLADIAESVGAPPHDTEAR